MPTIRSRRVHRMRLGVFFVALVLSMALSVNWYLTWLSEQTEDRAQACRSGGSPSGGRAQRAATGRWRYTRSRRCRLGRHVWVALTEIAPGHDMSQGFATNYPRKVAPGADGATTRRYPGGSAPTRNSSSFDSPGAARRARSG